MNKDIKEHEIENIEHEIENIEKDDIENIDENI